MSGTIKIILEVPQIPLLSALIESHPNKHGIIQQLLGSLSGIPQPPPQAPQPQPQAPQPPPQDYLVPVARHDGTALQGPTPISQRPQVIVSPVLAEQNLLQPIPVLTEQSIPVQSPVLTEQSLPLLSPVTLEKSILNPADYENVVSTFFNRYSDQAFGNAQIRANCGGTANQVRRALAKLIGKGLVTKFGEKLGTKYFWRNGGYNPESEPEIEVATPIKLIKPEIDWHAQPLGEMSDSALARKLSVAQSTVRVNRTALGITKFQSKPSNKTIPSEINWDEQPLGKMPDEKLAQRIGVTTGTVRRHRTDRNISANKPLPQVIEISPLDVPTKIKAIKLPTSSDFPEVDDPKEEKTLADRDDFLKNILSK